MSNLHRHKKYKDLHMKLIENIVSLKVDVDQLMPIIAMILCEVDYADRTAIILFDRDQEKGFIKTGFHVAHEDFRSDQGKCIKLKNYPEIMEVLSTKQMLLLNSKEDILKYLPSVEIKDQSGDLLYVLSSVLISPIFLNDNVIGIIRIDKAVEHEVFTEEDISFFRIITEHLSTVIELEEIRRLEKKQSFIQNILNSMQSMLIVADPDEKIKIVNRATLDTLGYTEEELVGKDIKKIIDIETIDFLEHKGILKEKEKAIAAKDGRKISVLLSGSIMWDVQFYVEGLICVAQDITKQKELELQLIESQRMEALGSLTGGIAHDFNNILTVIQGYSEHLLRMGIGEEKESHVKMIFDTAERGSQLTKQLLAFSRKQVIKPKFIQLNEKVKNLIQMADRILGKYVKLVVNLSDNLNTIKADPVQLDQVIMNLVINARDAMPGGGKVFILTRNITIDKKNKELIPHSREGKFIKLIIRDTGTGMNPEVLQHIFEPFYTTKGENKGTGLGLSVVHGIVSQHNGWINAYSRPGKGTTFNIFFPVKTKKVVKEHELECTSTQHKGNGETIFYVEDELYVINITSKILEKNGYRVLKSSNPTEALLIFEKEIDSIDMVLCDIALPEMSGYDLSKKILQKKPGLPILLYSAYIQEPFQIKKYDLEGIVFLQKPFTVLQLLRSVKKTITEIQAKKK